MGGIRANYVDRQYVTLEGLDDLPNEIFEILLQNEVLFKLIAYDSFDPISEPNLTDQQKRDLIYDRPQKPNARIYFASFADNVEDDEQSQLRIYVRNANTIQDNIAEIFFSIDVITHNDSVVIANGGNRILKMMIEVVKTLNGYIGTSSVGQLQIPLNGNLPLVYFNKRFQGYMIPIKARISNDTNCQTI